MLALPGLDCLRSMEQVTESRQRMVAAGTSTLSSAWVGFLHRLRLHPGPVVGDWLKSWDVCRVLEAIKAELRPDDPIADFGSYGCEVLPALAKMGFTRLHGIDLDARVGNMPAADCIAYSVGNFLTSSPLKAGSMAAVTSISVIEHGFDGEALAAELARVLRPGGLFLASFDYWPNKIDTTGIRLFGLDWRIFSRTEVQDFCAVAARHGLQPLPGGSLDCDKPVIHWGGQAYTFGWLALRKAQ